MPCLGIARESSLDTLVAINLHPNAETSRQFAVNRREELFIGCKVDVWAVAVKDPDRIVLPKSALTEAAAA